MKGTVKFYNIKNGYGFITAESGEDYFVHRTALNGNRIKHGLKVSFDVSEHNGKQVAVNVNLD